jgi:hypothetical protein
LTTRFSKWVEIGFAERFGELYDEDLKFRELYKQVVEEKQ